MPPWVKGRLAPGESVTYTLPLEPPIAAAKTLDLQVLPGGFDAPGAKFRFPVPMRR